MKLIRLFRTMLFGRFAGGTAIGGGSGKWVDTNPNETYGGDGE
jgi:hypothetical protein